MTPIVTKPKIDILTMRLLVSVSRESCFSNLDTILSRYFDIVVTVEIRAGTANVRINNCLL
jgi:hypothetical protein